MSYNVIPSNQFLKQTRFLDIKQKRIIEDKVDLIKQNPFRYKRIHSKKYSKVFRIRFSLNKKETRLIYIVIEPNIILVCLLDRKRGYKDLEKYLSKVG